MSRKYNLKPYGWAIGTVLLWAFFPVSTIHAGGQKTALFQIFTASCICSLFLLGWLKVFYKDVVSTQILKETYSLIREDRYLMVLQRITIGVYISSVAWTNAAVAAVIVDSWVLFYVLFDMVGDNSTKTPRKINVAGFMVVGLVGVGAVVYSQYGGFDLGGNWIFFGVLLFSAILQGGNIKTSIRYGRILADRHQSDNVAEFSVLPVIMVQFAWGSILGIGMIVGKIFGLPVGLPVGNEWVWCLSIWIVSHAFCMLWGRRTNTTREEHQIGVNSVFFFVFPSSVLLLALWNETVLSNGWWLLAGVAVILFSNFGSAKLKQ